MTMNTLETLEPGCTHGSDYLRNAELERDKGKAELNRLELHYKILHLKWMAETSGEALKRSMLSLADQLEDQL